MLANQDLAPRVVSIKSLSKIKESLTLEGEIDGHMKTITLNTGTAVSLIKRRPSNPGRIQPLLKNTILRTVTWDSAPVHEEADINITLGCKIINHRTMVADIEDDFIFGMNVIKQYSFSFDPIMNTVKFGNEEFVLSNKNSFRSVNMLLKIQATTEEIVYGKLETLGAVLALYNKYLDVTLYHL